MSSLGSWIDLEGLARVLGELCPDREDFPASAPKGFEDLAPPARASGGTAPPRGSVPGGAPQLVVVGRGLREAKAVVAGYPADEEVERVRTKLERIKAQARKSGLIQRTGLGGDPPSGSAPRTGHTIVHPEPTDEAAAAAHDPGTGTEMASGLRARAPDAASTGSGPSPSSAPPAFRPSDGTMGVRLNAFARWAAEATGGADVFVIDAQGYPLVERGGDPDLLGAALLLCDASLRASGQLAQGGTSVPAAAAVEGAVRNAVEMRLGSGLVLTVLPLETLYGMLCLGIHGRSAVPPSVASLLCEGLLAALGRR